MLRYVPSEASRVGLRFIVPDDVDEVTVVQELHRKRKFVKLCGNYYLQWIYENISNDRFFRNASPCYIATFLDWKSPPVCRPPKHNPWALANSICTAEAILIAVKLKFKGKYFFVDVGVSGNIILKWILQRWVDCAMYSTGLGNGSSVRFSGTRWNCGCGWRIFNQLSNINLSVNISTVEWCGNAIYTSEY